MLVLRSSLFDRLPEITFGFSTKIGLSRDSRYHFNLSHSVGDDKTIVEENRSGFFEYLGIPYSQFTFQKQVHGDMIRIVERPGFQGESDAMITGLGGIALAVTSADCAAIFIYDRYKKIIAAVHSGWRGTEKSILRKTLAKLANDFGSSPSDLFVYIAPSITQLNYEVGEDVAARFDARFVRTENGRSFLDVSGINYDQLLMFGVPEDQIQLSGLCSYGNKDLLHSYRREGVFSGRAFGMIMIKES